MPGVAQFFCRFFWRCGFQRCRRETFLRFTPLFSKQASSGIQPGSGEE